MSKYRVVRASRKLSPPYSFRASGKHGLYGAGACSAYSAYQGLYKTLFCSLAMAGLFLVAAFAGLPEGARAEKPLTLVVLGDSLTAGYQLPPGTGFPGQLQNALTERGYGVVVRNASVSGDTTSGALARLHWAIGPETDGVILELGANDALRGIDPALTRQNLKTLITRLQEKGIRVMLAGMRAPPNMGPAYAADFDSIYEDLAATYALDFYPFFLDGVAAQADLNLEDGIHPNKDGIGVIVGRIMPFVEIFLKGMAPPDTGKQEPAAP